MTVFQAAVLQSFWVRGITTTIILSCMSPPAPATSLRAKSSRTTTGAGCIRAIAAATLSQLPPSPATLLNAAKSTSSPSARFNTCTLSLAHRFSPTSTQHGCQCKGLLPPRPWLRWGVRPPPMRITMHLSPANHTQFFRLCFRICEN